MDQTCGNPRILLVEDDPDQQLLICDVIEMHYGSKCGRELVACKTGAESLRQDLESFDVVLLDYKLPDMTGLDVLQEILRRVDVPVIFVTGMKDTATAVQAIQLGAQDYLIKVGDYLFAIPVMIDKSLRQYQIRKENMLLQHRLEEMLRKLQVKNDQLEESLQKLATMAATDPLTNLVNRRAFQELLEKYFKQAKDQEYSLSCCMCDLDNYKKVNDTLGHQIGDELLVEVSKVIRSTLRGSDIAARYGGDEFILLLPRADLEGAMIACNRIQERMRQWCNQFADARSNVTVSIGLASLPISAVQSVDELIACADQALYHAKSLGKNRIVNYEPLDKAEYIEAQEAGTPPYNQPVRREAC